MRQKTQAQYQQLPLLLGESPVSLFQPPGSAEANQTTVTFWPQTLTLIRALHPRAVIIENVTGIVNLALDTILSDLESEGYTARPFIVPACAVGAVHIRARVFIVAYAPSGGSGPRRAEFEGQRRQTTPVQSGLLADSAASWQPQQPIHDDGHALRSPGVGTGDRDQRREVAEGILIDRRTIAESVSHPDRLGWGNDCRSEEGRQQAAAGRSSLPNLNQSGLSERGGLAGQTRRVFACEDPHLSDAHGDQAQRSAIERSQCLPGDVEPGMVRDVYGLPYRLDRPRWPAPMGQAQYTDEPPRTIQGYYGRADRIKALGNAVIPQVVYQFANAVREVLETQDRASSETKARKRVGL